MTATRPTCR